MTSRPSVSGKILFFRRSIFLIFLLNIAITGTQAQTNKITLSLYKMMQQPLPEARGGKVPVLIRGEADAITEFITAHNGRIKFATKNIVSASVDFSLITLLNEKDFVTLIDCPTGKIVSLNDVMVRQNNVDSAFYGHWPLDQEYDGSGVVIGIIDAPIDYKHPDFRDALGNTRIKYLWDQNKYGTNPAEFDYGNECDSTDLANGTCDHSDAYYYYSHGTGVTGVAASSGSQYRGVAPNADIIFVSLNFGDFLSNAVDAIAYIFEKANEMGKPCVINTSFGTYAGSHDGKDITSQAIAELVEAKNGRAVVAAAGNAGSNAIHLGYDVTETKQFTWFKKLSSYNSVYFQVWADSADFDDVIFSLSADNSTDFSCKGSTPDYNILTDYDLTGGAVGMTTYDIYDGGELMGTVEIYAQKIDGTYLLSVDINSAAPANYWRFTTSGEGRFDIYSTEGFTGCSNYVTTGLPDTSILPEIVNYRMPDIQQNMVSYWQCSDKVITVGSYVNRDSMTNFYGINPPFYDVAGELFLSSSHGPTRDGRIKPDICATGARVLSTGSSVLTSWLISLGAANYMSPDGQHYLQNGTSFASPVVTGIAALYLQKNPDASFEEIKNAILSNARKDAFTGDLLPDNEWGYGKADAFRTLTGPWGCSADDYLDAPKNLELVTVTSTGVKAEWDIIPNAAYYQVVVENTSRTENVKRNADNTHRIINTLTPGTNYTYKVRARCDGLGYSEWSDPLYFTTIPLKEEMYGQEIISVYPNPAANNITIEGIHAGKNHIVIFNLMGEKVLEENFQTEGDNIELNINNLANGMYTLIIQNESVVLSGKIMIGK